MIEAVAKLFAESGPLGLVILGCFALAIEALLVMAYLLIHILACLQDDKALRFQNNIYRDRRQHASRRGSFGLLMRIVRRLRGWHD